MIVRIEFLHQLDKLVVELVNGLRFTVDIVNHRIQLSGVLMFGTREMIAQ